MRHAAALQAGDEGVLALSTLTRLEVLDISGTTVMDAALAVLPFLRCLRRLSVVTCKISDAGAPV